MVAQVHTFNFMLSPTRAADAAEHFFRQALRASHAFMPRVIAMDKHAAYSHAFEALQQERILQETCVLRRLK